MKDRTHMMNHTIAAAALLLAPVPLLAQHGLPAVIDAPPDGQLFGFHVASGGDANHDGYDDIFVTDEWSNQNGEPVGRWYMYSGQDRSLLWSAEGTEATDPDTPWFACEFIGDLDGDRCDDIILGREGLLGGRGGVDVFSGRSGELLHSIRGAQPGDRLGRGLCGIRDLDGDSVADFALVTRHAEDGAVSVRSGADGSEILRVDSAWPRRVRDAGDVDGDHKPDLAIGLNRLGQPSTHHLLIASGADGSEILNIARPDGFDLQFAYQVSAGADVTGDNVPDLLVSGDFADRRAYLISGATGEVVTRFGDRFNFGINWFGKNLFFADVNGDGAPEAVISSLEEVFAYDPLTAATLCTWVTEADFYGESSGGNEVATGDVNHDGVNDIIAGVRGQVRIRSGGPLLLSFDPYVLRNEVRRGNSEDFLVYSGAPDRPIYLIASRRGVGCTFVQQLGICIDLQRRLHNLGTAVTDAEGVATFEFAVPGQMPLGTVWLQALDVHDPTRGPITSNVLEIDIVN